MNGPIGDQKVLVISTYKTVNTLPISYFALSVGAPASTVSDASALSLVDTLPYVYGLPYIYIGPHTYVKAIVD